MITADNLSTVRRYAGVTARRLADMINVTPSFICKIESGECPLPSDRAIQIQTVLGLDAEKLLLIEETCKKLKERGD